MRIERLIVLLLLVAGSTQAQSGDGETFSRAASDVRQQLEESTRELVELRARVAEETLPLSEELSSLEAELNAVKAELDQVNREIETRTLDLSQLGGTIESREKTNDYLARLLSDYISDFRARLHIVEQPRYEAGIEATRLAGQNENLAPREVYELQLDLLRASLDRLDALVGGEIFSGAAVDPAGRVKEGIFALVGPAALFRSRDGRDVGTAEELPNLLGPAAITFREPVDRQATEALLESGDGTFLLDPTLGMAHELAASETTLWEEIQDGGAVMVPIFVLAATALLVALLKWLSMVRLRRPSPKKIKGLLKALSERDADDATRRVQAIRGPVGTMLRAGVDHVEEPRELIEEVLYERVLTTKNRLQGYLPFIAICAASAPLLGLLGTVTGIISTFDLIKQYGSGDVKMLSGGISEALITTKFGLIVAIPSLLIHAYLSRKARAIVGSMETTAVAFVNQLAKTPFRPSQRVAATHSTGEALHMSAVAPDPELVREQVNDILSQLLGPLVDGNHANDLVREKAPQPG